MLLRPLNTLSSHHIPQVSLCPLLLPLLGCRVQDVRTLMQALTTTRTALKQADVRIAILEERILSLQQVQHGACGRGGLGLCGPRGEEGEGGGAVQSQAGAEQDVELMLVGL